MIVIVNPVVPPRFAELLVQHGDVRVPGKEKPIDLADARVIVTTPMDTIDAAFIERLPSSVGLIANIGVGTDHIDLAAAAAHSVAVSNTPVVTEDTADLAFALILAACRRLPQGERLLREGRFAEAHRQLGTRANGKTLGIVGLGSIGQAVARRAAGFGMSVHYWGPRRKQDAEADTGARWCDDLDALIGQCDIVSLHCPLKPETRHLVDAKRLARFKQGGILVNTGRGPLVDEAALVVALRDGPLGAAGLDVFEFEPKVSPGLLELDNVVLLPHIGGATAEGYTDVAVRVSLNIGHFLANGQPLDPVGRIA